MTNTVAVLVCYYPDFKEKSVSTLRQMLNSIDPTAFLLIVNNRESCHGLFATGGNEEITGSNQAWEFSAWDEGIAHLQQHQLIRQDTLVILANDTFCFNRTFNLFNRWIFCRGFRQVRQHSNRLAGELCTTQSPYTICNYSGSGWVSTYLFACTGAMLMHSLLPFSKSAVLMQTGQIRIDSERRNIQLPASSPAIIQHLEQWFFPEGGQHGWYKVKNRSANPELVRLKLLAVLNEKLLSAIGESKGIELYNVYSNRLFRKLLRWQKSRRDS